MPYEARSVPCEVDIISATPAHNTKTNSDNRKRLGHFKKKAAPSKEDDCSARPALAAWSPARPLERHFWGFPAGAESSRRWAISLYRSAVFAAASSETSNTPAMFPIKIPVINPTKNILTTPTFTWRLVLCQVVTR